MGPNLPTRRTATALVAAVALGLSAGPEAGAQSAAGTASSMVVSRVDPEMPPGVHGEARASCTITFQVGIDGAPGPVAPAEVTVAGCDEPFKAAADAAARQWRFQPNLLGGKAYPYKYTARLDFRNTTSAGDIHHQLAAGAGSGAGSQVVVQQRAMPVIPDDWQRRLEAEGLEEIHWRVRIKVGADGLPTSAEVLQAPAFLGGALRDAAMMWAFEPVVVEKTPQPFSYLWEHRWVPL